MSGIKVGDGGGAGRLVRAPGDALNIDGFLAAIGLAWHLSDASTAPRHPIRGDAVLS